MAMLGTLSNVTHGTEKDGQDMTLPHPLDKPIPSRSRPSSAVLSPRIERDR